MPSDPLANPVWHALTGDQRDLALGAGLARTFRPDVGRFSAVGEASDAAFSDLATLLGAGAEARLVRPETPEPVPDGWQVLMEKPLIQMVADADIPAPPDAPAGMTALGPADGAEMLALARLTNPGPFEPMTVRLGGYVGVRRDGRLVAMAGHRMKPPGHVEVSAICTHPDWRGQGLATALTLIVMGRIRAGGAVPMLHLYADNEGALALYRKLGFRTSRPLAFRFLKTPG